MPTLLDSWAVISTVRTTPGSFSVSAGSNRVFIGFSWTRGNPTIANPTTAISMGGQSLTRLNLEQTTFGADQDSAIWILDEAGLAAAANGNFSITPSASGSFLFVGAVYEDVNQSELTVDNLFSDNGTSGANPPSQALDVEVDSVVVTALLANQSSGSPDASYSNMTERLENNPLNGYFSVADATIASGSTFTPGTTLTHDQTAHIQAMALQPAGPELIEGTASGDAVSGGTADPGVIAVGSARGDAISGGRADPIVFQPASASGDAVSGGTADPATLAEPSSASGDGVSGGQASAVVNVLASTTATATSGGSANASEFSGARATAAAASGGTANAAEPIAIIPPVAIEDSVIGGQRPVLLINLFLDSGERNIWTRPSPGIFAQKEYQPLDDVTGGFTVRNNLDNNSLDASIQLSGQSDEILAIALLENYRNRQAEIILANLDEAGEIEAVETLLTGVIVNMTASDTGTESSVDVVIESVFKDVNRAEVRRAGTTELNRTSPGDTFFDFLETTQTQEPRFGAT